LHKTEPKIAIALKIVSEQDRKDCSDENPTIYCGDSKKK
jgi:hypothetical protein